MGQAGRRRAGVFFAGLLGALCSAALCAGCELAVQFETVPETASTTGGGHGGDATGGGAGGIPDCATGCDDQNDCTDDVCEGGVCKNKYRPEGTPVADQATGDCQRDVCDGLGHVKKVVDDTDDPPAGVNPCHDLVCQGGMVIPLAKNEGVMCSDQATECHHFECSAGACAQVNKLDGTMIMAGGSNDCRDTVCQNGELNQVTNDANCPDSDVDDCKLPDCKTAGTCGTKNVPFGTACKKAGGGSGLCDFLGTCN